MVDNFELKQLIPNEWYNLKNPLYEEKIVNVMNSHVLYITIKFKNVCYSELENNITFTAHDNFNILKIISYQDLSNFIDYEREIRNICFCENNDYDFNVSDIIDYCNKYIYLCDEYTKNEIKKDLDNCLIKDLHNIVMEYV